MTSDSDLPISYWEPNGRRTVELLCAGLLLLTGCESSPNRASSDDRPSDESAPPPQTSESSRAPESGDRPAAGPDDRREERLRMVERQIAGRDLEDPDVLRAMRTVPRHAFVPEPYADRAYADTPLPIGHDQTISQPYIVAKMTEALRIEPEHEVLEIGTGSGYQAAVLAELVDHVYTIEIVCELAEDARQDLTNRGYENVTVRCGDGYAGWPEKAPFDRIIVTAAPPEIPDALVDQLANGGRMILPVGDRRQKLKVVQKRSDGSVETSEMMGVRFVPMVHGDAEP